MRTAISMFLFTAALGLAQNAVQVSNYLFQDNFNPQRVGSAALTPANPSGNNRFLTETVFGQSRRVYEMTGAATPRTAQGGFTYNAKNKVPRDNYSIDMVFAFNAPILGNWRRILDVLNRNSSEGLYIDTQSYINYYSGAGTNVNALQAGTYYHVALVKRPGEIFVYVNGALVASRTGGTSLGIMEEQRNPDQLVHFLLDDDGEWASAKVALFRVYSGALTAAEVQTIYAAPFTSTVGLPAPGFQSSGIVNSASYSATNAIVPGAFFTIFGTDLGDDFSDWSQSFVNNFAPRRLSNVRVLVNNVEAFISFVSSTQINAIAPDNVTPGPATVVVEYSNLRSTSVSTQAQLINPAVFRFTPQNNRYLASTANDGSAYIGPANLFNTNGVLNGLALRPARAGEFIVIYGTGLGPTAPAVPAGQIPAGRNGGYPITSAAEVRLTRNGQTTAVVPAYAGLSGFPGLHQIVFQMPNLAAGDYEVVLAVNGIASPTGAFLPVGP